MATTEDIMALANDYANADNVIDSAQKQQALRLAVDRLVAEKQSMRLLLSDCLEALEYHQEQTRPIHSTKEAIAALRAALRGQP